MMSELRAKLYNLERQYINTIITDGVESDAIKTDISGILMQACPTVIKNATDTNHYYMRYIHKINLSSEFLRKCLNGINVAELHNIVTENEVSEAVSYVEQLLDIDLSHISVLKLDKQVRANAEGFCVTCNNDEHFIFYQPDENGVISTDLIVHELGHAAEFSISRSQNNDALLIPHSAISEAVAYYCQFKYLLEYGTSMQRAGSIGAFLFTYLAIIICRICIKNETSLNNIDVHTIINSDECRQFIDSYNYDETKLVENKINILKELYPDLMSLTHHEISPRLGVVLAIFLLDKPLSFIKEIIKKNAIQNDIDIFFKEIIPEGDLSIKNLEIHFENYFCPRG
ncbi:hypothetical protein [Aeromonas veronii]|uniref:hypothetical protein n=1 Tax=Aeromonas veronii TaxID=654 RepID=UPI0039827B51